METKVTPGPFEHPHATSFEYKIKLDNGKPLLVLEVATDLRGEEWSETAEGRSLSAAVEHYMCAPDCRVRRIDVFPIG